MDNGIQTVSLKHETIRDKLKIHTFQHSLIVWSVLLSVYKSAITTYRNSEKNKKQKTALCLKDRNDTLLLIGSELSVLEVDVLEADTSVAGWWN